MMFAVSVLRRSRRRLVPVSEVLSPRALVRLVAVLAIALGGGAARAEGLLSGMSVASLTPTAAGGPPARVAADPTGAPGEAPNPEMLRWLLVSHALSAPVGDVAREALAASLRLGDVGALRLREAPPVEPELLLLSSVWDSVDSPSVKKAIESGEPWQLVHFSAASALPAGDARVTARGQMAYSPQGSEMTRPGDDTLPEALTLDLRLELGDFEVGAGRRAFGKAADRVISVPQLRRDQESTEVWLAQRVGALRLQVSRAELADNVDRDPTLARTTKNQTAVTAEVGQGNWPMLGLTYAVGDAERAWWSQDRRARLTDRQTYDNVIGSLYYHAELWDLTAATTYGRSRPTTGGAETVSLYHDLTLTLRLTDSLTLMPSVGTGSDWYEAMRTEGGTSSASLSLSYALPVRRWYAWSYASYSASRIAEARVDGRAVSVAGGITRELGTLGSARASVSLEVGYDRYADVASPAASSEGAYGFVLFKLARF